jgi:hypothetical protein
LAKAIDRLETFQDRVEWGINAWWYLQVYLFIWWQDPMEECGGDVVLMLG